MEIVAVHGQILAGAAAGMFEVCLMYPLDLCKTRQMLDSRSDFTGRAAGNKNIISTISSIRKNEGFLALYRGIGAPILMEVPKRALKFTVNDISSGLILKLGGRKSANIVTATSSGLLAGLTEAMVVAPFEKIKIKMQGLDSATKYTSSLDCLRKTLKSEGISTLTKGLHATMFCQGIWNATYFGTIWSVRNAAGRSRTPRPKVVVDMAAGSIGGLFATIAGTPFDVVKSRIQNLELSVSDRPPRTLSVLAQIGRNEGFGAWYKGFRPKAARLVPGGGILLVAFEQAKLLF